VDLGSGLVAYHICQLTQGFSLVRGQVVHCSRKLFLKLELDEILARAANVETWLNKYAPDYVKFQLKEELPAAVNNLTPDERKALGELADMIGYKTAAEIHDEVYAVARENGMDPKKFFQAIYLAFLGDRQGPKAGWFLASLDRDFVKARLNEAASSGQ